MQIIKFDAIDSTSSYLRQLLTQSEVADGTVIWALSQHDGRGQPGRSWQVEGGKNLTFSLLRVFKFFSAREHFLLNIRISLAVVDVLAKYGIPNLCVKWPNDIMSGQKKICGILIENQLQGNQLIKSVIGVGLNVNQIQFTDLPNATSMSCETGNSFDLETLLHELCLGILSALPQDMDYKVAHQREAYEKILFGIHETREYEEVGGLRFQAVNLGIDPQGMLVLELQDKTRKAYSFQSIRLIH